MFQKEVLSAIDPEQLYKHVYHLEGTRHEITAPDNLEKAKNYILQELKSYGYATHCQVFEIEQMDKIYYNVEGFTGSNRPQILITSHFDTVFNTPGADDNASAVAIMLEIARVAKINRVSDGLRFVSFNFEEVHPFVQKLKFEKGRELGIFDAQFRYKNLRAKNMMQSISRLLIELRTSEVENILDEAINQLEVALTSEEEHYLREIYAHYNWSSEDIWEQALFSDNLQIGTLGSREYLKYVRAKDMKIAGVINMESVGYTSTKKNSQTPIPGIDLEDLPHHKVNDSTIGDFLVVVADKNSIPLANTFLENARFVDLKTVNVPIPMEIEGIMKSAPDTLRSDHAHFWRYRIPAIVLSDTANFRNPNYHSPGDVINTLDFGFMEKISRTVLMTAMHFRDEIEESVRAQLQ